MSPKILHLVDSLNCGGVQTSLKAVFESQKDNKDIFLFALRKTRVQIEIHHPSIFVFNSPSKFSLAPLFYLHKIVKKHRTKILHCHLFRTQFIGWLYKCFVDRTIKLVFHEHGKVFVGSRIYKVFMNRAQPKVDLFVAASQSTKDMMVATTKIPLAKIKVLYNFADLGKFNPEKRQAIRNKTEKNKNLIIGFIGRLSPIKNIDTLIKAVASLKMSDIRIVVAGTGPEKQHLEGLVQELGLAKQVSFLGYRGDILNIYARLDIIVLCSKSEASPITFYESQALGVPMIASNVPATNELIQDGYNGLLFNYAQVSDMADKIKIM